MSRPTLPPKTTKNIKEITPQTWNQLIDCVTYAMNHPRGDGQNILNDDSNGMLHFKDRPQTISQKDWFCLKPDYRSEIYIDGQYQGMRIFHTIEEFAESGLDSAVVYKDFSDSFFYPYEGRITCTLYKNMSTFKRKVITDPEANVPVRGYLYQVFNTMAFLDSTVPYDSGTQTITGFFETISQEGTANGVVKLTMFDNISQILYPCRLEPIL